MYNKKKLIASNVVFAVILFAGIAFTVYVFLYEKIEPAKYIKPLGVIILSLAKLISNFHAIRKANFETAGEEFRRYDSFFSDSRKTQALFKKGYKLYAQDETKRALQVLSKALKEADKEDNYKGKGVLYFIIGACYEDLMKTEKAIENYTAALRDNPYLDSVWSNMGIIYMNESNFEKARQCFEKALSVNPSKAQAYNNLGALYLRQNNVGEAITFYKKALDTKPNYGVTLGNLAYAYALNGDLENSDKYLKLASANGYTEWKQLKKQIDNLKT
jgi:Flp pilus assembly protein TadD, contains TPR repeats